MMWALHALSIARRKLSHGEVRGGFRPCGWGGVKLRCYHTQWREGWTSWVWISTRSDPPRAENGRVPSNVYHVHPV